jgi:hypothetical protein
VITSGFHHGVLVVHDFVGFFDLVYFLVDWKSYRLPKPVLVWWLFLALCPVFALI